MFDLYVMLVYGCTQRSGLGVVAEFEKLSARYDSLVKLIS